MPPRDVRQHFPRLVRRGGEHVRIPGAQNDLVDELAVHQSRIGADRHVRQGFRQLAEAFGVGAFRQAVRIQGFRQDFAPVTSFGATSSIIACITEGTPAMTMTLPSQKPGALEIGLATSSAPSECAPCAGALRSCLPA